ncbi:MAG TPA: GNAT family N-acetyltransferase [Thermoplasmata archaeon]|nr:GNAT family N-acetyltransferase [Thermoplasmata archaeon]
MQSVRVVDLVGKSRELAVPILVDSFVGIYRWHATRTLHRVSSVRGAFDGNRLIGVSLLADLAPGIGYVYYVAVLRDHRKERVGSLLVEDALLRFKSQKAEIVYAAAEEENAASIALFKSHGFRVIAREERGYREGGLGAWGLRSKMMLVSGEVLFGVRINPPGTSVRADPPQAAESTPRTRCR